MTTTGNVIPIRPAIPDDDGLTITRQAIPGRATVHLTTVTARHSDRTLDTRETGVLIDTTSSATLSASQARRLAEALLVAADELDRQQS